MAVRVTIREDAVVRCELLASDDQGVLCLTGSDETFDAVTATTVIDPATGDRVGADTPERWALLLPAAFRAGELSATIEARS